MGRSDNKVIFVPFTVPGDFIEATIIEDKKKFSRARLHKVLTPSPHRIAPSCTLFETCGGCDWQHMNYNEQLRWKERHLAEALSRIGNVSPHKFLPIVPSDDEFHYRNRIRGDYKNHSFYFHKKKSHEKVKVKNCPIADSKINEFLPRIPKKWNGKNIELQVVQGSVQVLEVHKNRSTDLGFQQVNIGVYEKLMLAMIDKIPTSNITKIVDLYCGKGQWTTKLAQVFPQAQVVGVDSLPSNITKAREGQLPGNLQFVLGTVEETIGFSDLEQAYVTVDPPRAGLSSSVLETLIQAEPLGLLYVSCHQATLARDVKVLTETAFELISAQPCDMFPQTSHCEALAALRLKSP